MQIKKRRVIISHGVFLLLMVLVKTVKVTLLKLIYQSLGFNQSINLASALPGAGV